MAEGPLAGLPATRTAFIGRDREQAAILEALAYAASIADRFAEDFPEKIPHQRLRQPVDEATRGCPSTDPVCAAYVTAADAWTAQPEQTVPDPALASQALAAARRIDDPS